MAKLVTGDIFAGKHRLDRLLGEGFFSEVWEATHTTLGQPHAIKVMHEALTNPRLVERFQREARAMAAMVHPNLVRVVDAGVQDGRPYLVMEYHESTDLRQLFAQGQLGHLRSLDIMADVLRALVVAHEYGILHRDVKPENVLVGADGITRLTDFGIAKIMEGDAGMTQIGDKMGTPRYMAPEQKGALLQAQVESDLYAVGLIIYELLGGEIPTDLRVTVDLYVAEVRATKLMGFPSSIRRLIERSTMYSPEDRYRSAEEMLGAVLSARRQLERELRGARAPTIPEPPIIIARVPTPVPEVQPPLPEPEAAVESPPVVASESSPPADTDFGFDPYGDVSSMPARWRRPVLYIGLAALLVLGVAVVIFWPSGGEPAESVQVDTKSAEVKSEPPEASAATSGVLPRPTPIFSSETSTSSTAGGPPGRVTPAVATAPAAEIPTEAAKTVPVEKPKAKPKLVEAEKPFRFTPVTVLATPTMSFRAEAWPSSQLRLRYRAPGEPWQEPRSFKEVSPGQFEATLPSASFVTTGFDYFVEATGPAGQTEKTATFKVRGP